MISGEHKLSIFELRQRCQASSPNPQGESLVGRFSRVFSIYFTRFFIFTSLTPNQITGLSVIVFFGGLLLLLFDSQIWNIVAAIIIFFSIILDGCDGEVARYRKSGGITGTLYVEPMSHDIQYGLAFFLVGLILFKQTGESTLIVAGAGASIAKLIYRLLDARAWALKTARQTVEELRQESLNHLVNFQDQFLVRRIYYWVNKNLFSSTALFPVLLIAALLGRMELFLYFFCVGYTLFSILLFGKQIYDLTKGRL
ncbi:MAG TPA: CDP-alcohol phosphatidyltransferase family protein [Patescibacteria group bacterium]|nr:CDP-alcohol phosphatidyltransferase family protein [Patescibacteria group bacterium]